MTLTPKDLIKEEIFNSHTGKYEIKKVTVETSKVADELAEYCRLWTNGNYIEANALMYNLNKILRGESQEGKR